MKKILTATNFICLMLILFCISAGAQGFTPIIEGTVYSGEFDDNATRSEYQFTPQRSGNYKISFGSARGTKILLYDDAKNLTFEKESLSNNENIIWHNLDAGKTYYAVVKLGVFENRGSYRFSLDYENTKSSYTLGARVKSINNNIYTVEDEDKNIFTLTADAGLSFVNNGNYFFTISEENIITAAREYTERKLVAGKELTVSDKSHAIFDFRPETDGTYFIEFNTDSSFRVNIQNENYKNLVTADDIGKFEVPVYNLKAGNIYFVDVHYTNDSPTNSFSVKLQKGFSTYSYNYLSGMFNGYTIRSNQGYYYKIADNRSNAKNGDNGVFYIDKNNIIERFEKNTGTLKTGFFTGLTKTNDGFSAEIFTTEKTIIKTANYTTSLFGRKADYSECINETMINDINNFKGLVSYYVDGNGDLTEICFMSGKNIIYDTEYTTSFTSAPVSDKTIIYNRASIINNGINDSGFKKDHFYTISLYQSTPDAPADYAIIEECTPIAKKYGYLFYDKIREATSIPEITPERIFYHHKFNMPTIGGSDGYEILNYKFYYNGVETENIRDLIGIDNVVELYINKKGYIYRINTLKPAFDYSVYSYKDNVFTNVFGNNNINNMNPSYLYYDGYNNKENWNKTFSDKDFINNHRYMIGVFETSDNTNVFHICAEGGKYITINAQYEFSPSCVDVYIETDDRTSDYRFKNAYVALYNKDQLYAVNTVEGRHFDDVSTFYPDNISTEELEKNFTVKVFCWDNMMTPTGAAISKQKFPDPEPYIEAETSGMVFSSENQECYSMDIEIDGIKWKTMLDDSSEDELLSMYRGKTVEGLWDIVVSPDKTAITTLRKTSSSSARRHTVTFPVEKYVYKSIYGLDDGFEYLLPVSMNSLELGESYNIKYYNLGDYRVIISANIVK